MVGRRRAWISRYGIGSFSQRSALHHVASQRLGRAKGVARFSPPDVFRLAVFVSKLKREGSLLSSTESKSETEYAFTYKGHLRA
jgi:hypothetical protein